MTNNDKAPAPSANALAAARRAAETNAMTFDMTGIRADRSRNFSRGSRRTHTTRARRTIR